MSNPDENVVSNIVDMGFTRNKVLSALKVSIYLIPESLLWKNKKEKANQNYFIWH